MADVDRLFDEFAAAYVRGEQPDLVAFVRLAGEDGDELARLIDVFLRVAPAPEPRDDDVAVMRARLEGEPGLLALRRRRARKVDEVVADLAERLEVDDVPRLKRYYQRLEGGILDPRRVDERVWEALRELFVTNVRAIVRPLATTTGGSAMAYYRRGGEPLPDLALPSAAPRMEVHERLAAPRGTSPPERDELDRLFLGDDCDFSGHASTEDRRHTAALRRASPRQTGVTLRRATKAAPTMIRPAPASAPIAAAVPVSTDGRSNDVPESAAAGVARSRAVVASPVPKGPETFASIPRAVRPASSAPGTVWPTPR